MSDEEGETGRWARKRKGAEAVTQESYRVLFFFNVFF